MDYKNSDDPAHDGQIRIIVRFDGTLDEARMRNAVRLAFDAEPVTGCRFVERPLRPYWQRCHDLESAFEFHLVDPSDLEKAGTDFLLSPMDLFNGPQVKVGLFRSGADTLYIKMSHIVADGGASFEYLQLLSGIYRRLGDDPEYYPEVNLRGCRNSFQVLRHVKLTRILAACTRVSVSKPAWVFPAAGNEDLTTRLFIRRIGRERVSRIRAYAKDHGVTVGDMLITAYYRALFELIDPPENVPLPLLVPVDLRRYIPGGRGEGICSLTAGYFPEVARRKAEPFEGTLARVHAVMERNKTRLEEVGQIFLMELAFAPGNLVPRIAGPLLSSALVFPNISNIGVIDPGIADFGDVPVREIFPAGGITRLPNYLLGSHSFGGEMVLTSIVLGTEEDMAMVDRFFGMLLGELPGDMPVEDVQKVPAAAGPALEMARTQGREKSASDA